MAERDEFQPRRRRIRRAAPPVTLLIVCVGGLIALASSSSCYTQGVTTCGQDEAPLVLLRGRLTGDALVTDDAGRPVLDDAGFVIPVLQTDQDGNLVRNAQGDPVVKRGPQSGSTVAVELCGLYSANPDPSRAHPNYRHATVTREDGTFEVMVPKGTIGIHTFKEGWFYGRLEVKDPEQFVDDPRLTEVAARNSKPPQLSNFQVRPAAARPGQMLTFSIETKRAGTDPMSEELIVYELGSGAARAFAPPSRGAPLREIGAARAGWPDGTWTATMPAPMIPGTYTFFAHSTSEHCVSSNKVALEVVVR